MSFTERKALNDHRGRQEQRPSSCEILKAESSPHPEDSVTLSAGSSHCWGDSSDAVPSKVTSIHKLTIFQDLRGNVVKRRYRNDSANGNRSATQSAPRPSTPNNTAENGPSCSRKTLSPTPDKQSYTPRHRTPTSPSRYQKSPTRRRSSSTQSMTPELESVFAEMKGDQSYHEPVWKNEADVVDLIKMDFAYTDKQVCGRVGHVYAFRDRKRDLVKIGFSRSVRSRVSDIVRKCHLSPDIDMISDDKEEGILAFKRLEHLVHADLSPHRFYFPCVCGVDHHEWYEISDKHALETIRVWREFLKQDPYGPVDKIDHYRLQSKWVSRLGQREEVPEAEDHEDHERRLQRWRRLFTPLSEAAPIPAGDKVGVRVGDATIPTSPEDHIKVEPESDDEVDMSHISILPSIERQSPSVEGSVKDATEVIDFQDNPQALGVTSQIDKDDDEYSDDAFGDECDDEGQQDVDESEQETAGEDVDRGQDQIDAPVLTADGDASQVELTKRMPESQGTTQKVPVSLKLTSDLPNSPGAGPTQVERPRSSLLTSLVDQQADSTSKSSQTKDNASDGQPGETSELYAPLQAIRKSLADLHAMSTSSSSTAYARAEPESQKAGGIEMDTLRQSLMDWAQTERNIRRRNNIRKDMHVFRWQFACGVLCALLSPYAPAGLSTIAWLVFLPFFAGELRGW